uniref:Helicase C-terminal domain-containing protein n=1 Tax=Euplotes crassus TaxID=5936 RepID=A0A7S3KPB4_EUPCR|mmetsp:Transcript_38139/g.37642  ORF Transcript_38139/g.37642 Transcript_38139/m.37642 type:complete len:198 (+) Transcript_38139:674-1267(+)
MKQKATCIHSLLPLHQRMKNLFLFKAERIPVLVATDLASRGLDIPSVDLVINFDVPVEPIDYVHRTGRTARAGRGGMAITFITQYDIKLIYSIEEYASVKLEEVDAELQSTEDQVLDDMALVSKVSQSLRIMISESGFEDKLEQYRKQKHNFKNRTSEKAEKAKKKSKNISGYQQRKRRKDFKHNGKNKQKRAKKTE